MFVRLLNTDDFQQFRTAHALGWERHFANNGEDELRRLERNSDPLVNVSDSRIWGTFSDDGTLATSITEFRHEIRFDGSWQRSCGIADVVTRPDMRYLGAMKACLLEIFRYMHEENIPFSMLSPFNVPFYRKFGYETINPTNSITISLSALSAFKCDISRIEALDKEGQLKELDCFYNETLSDTNLALKRDLNLWRRIAGVSPCTQPIYTYIFRNTAGNISGFFSFTQAHPNNIKTMSIHECLYRDIDTLKQMLGFINSFVPHYEKVYFGNLPDFLDFYRLLPDYSGFSHDHKLWFMLRVVNAEQALAAKRYPDKEDSFSLRLNDSTLDWNTATYNVSFGGGKCSITKSNSDNWDIAVDERAFARILFGEDALMSETMRFVPGLEIKNNRDTLERVFTKRPLYFTDGF
ncbi:MAG: GNAT family N-acetyltransferase [Oscillospiraceae bacterium]|nr:GNAT family N-acetyltransferase [Oscillospiraceae bacterium]